MLKRSPARGMPRDVVRVVVLYGRFGWVDEHGVRVDVTLLTYM
jgi:hypothetical protein